MNYGEDIVRGFCFIVYSRSFLVQYNYKRRFMVIYRIKSQRGNLLIDKNDGIFEIEAGSVTRAW